MTRIGDATCVLAILAFAVVAGCSSSDPRTMMAKAQEYRQKSDYKAAVIELKNVLQKDPAHAEARYMLGITYNEMADYTSADKELHRALELNYNKSDVLPALGRSLLMQGAFQKVLDEIRLDDSADGKDQAAVLTQRALALLGLGHVDEGRALLQEALAKQPEFADALLAQARLAARDKRLDEARRLIERAIASAPNSVDAWLMKGDLARATGDEAGAAAAYQKILEFSPENNAAHLDLALLQIAGGKFQEARKHITQLRKTSPNNLMAVYAQALLEFRQRNYSAARETVQQVLKVAPEHMPSVLLAGAVELALGAYAQAQSYMERVLARAPENMYARKLLAASLAKTGQAERAMDVVQAGLKQAPEDSGLLSLAGELYMQRGEFSRATEYLQQAAKREPNSAGLRTKLGLSRLALGETDRAFGDLESAVHLERGEYQSDIVLILSELKRANYDDALKAMQSLEAKQPNNPLTYNLKGAIYVGKKDIVSARKEFEHALQLQPSFIAAAVNLARLDLGEKNPRAARGRLETIITKDKDNVQALIALAELGPQIGAAQKEQIEWLERASKVSPDLLQPKVMLIQAYARAGELKNALEVALRAQARDPDNPQVLDLLGAAQLAVGQKEQALGTFEKLASLRPKSPEALYRLANAQAVNSNIAAATNTLKKAVALKPDFAAAQVALVGLEVRDGHIPEAMKMAQQLQKQSPKSALGFVLEGDVLMIEKKFPQAVAAYETAYRLRRSGAVVVKLHAAYMQAGKPREAEARLAQWLKESPDDASSRLYAAAASLRDGRVKNAIEQYEWLQQKQPDNVLVLNNLAWAYQQVKDPRALETAERAYKLSPNAATGDTLGWILVEQGETVRGLDLLRKAVATAPNTPTIRYHLAYGSFKAGDKSKARDELERLIKSDAQFPQKVEAMDLLKQLRN